MSGRAIFAGTGEIRFTQYDKSRCEHRDRDHEPTEAPEEDTARIMSRDESTSGPPTSTTLVTSGWSSAPMR